MILIQIAYYRNIKLSLIKYLYFPRFKVKHFNDFLINTGKGQFFLETPLPYIPREKNIIQTILQENYADFEKIYDEVYAKDYGIYQLEI